MDDKIKLFHGDCLEIMEHIPDMSIDMILCDLPYGVTECKWDAIIPFEMLWKQYWRLIKGDGVIVLFSSQPFTTKLISSNMKDFKYCWYWIKTGATGHAFAKSQPMRKIEEICVFYKSAGEWIGRSENFEPLRKYLKEEREKTGLTAKKINELLGNSMASHYFTNGIQWELPNELAYSKLQTTGFFARDYQDVKAEYDLLKNDNKIERPIQGRYYPQGVIKLGKPLKKTKNRVKDDSIYSETLCRKEYVQQYTNYPNNILEFSNNSGELSSAKRLHPTQKPVDLLEYLIKTYTGERETVLDNCMGSGSTGVAAINQGRFFIGIEKDERYFNIAKQRIEAV